jgi:sugar phosphate isomerase/epimerase
MKPRIILSGFADEAANQKTTTQQFAAFAALGLQYFTLRFIDAGNGIKNAMLLDDSEIRAINELRCEYGIRVSSLGSPIGKVKLCDIDDGTSNRYVPFAEYLAKDVQRACDLAHALDTKLVRGFSFYHPKGTDSETHLAQATDQLGEIARACEKNGLIFGLEVEANLVGQTGRLLAEIHRQVASDALMLIFDGANLVCQGMTPDQVFAEYLAMKPGLGWLHIKDYRHSSATGRIAHVDEASLKNFVPAHLGDTGHEAILRDLASDLPALEQRLKAKGIDGVFFDLEPHVKGGGQFGGFSGPDGFGVALRSLCRVLDYVGIDYHLRDFNDILACRAV